MLADKKEDTRVQQTQACTPACLATRIGILLLLVLLASCNLATLLGGNPGRISVTLAWNPSVSTALTGYKVYVGTSSGKYGTGIVVGNVLRYTVTGLARGVTYYFATTSYNATQESGFSSEISWVAH